MQIIVRDRIDGPVGYYCEEEVRENYPPFTNIPDPYLRLTNITKQQLMEYYVEMHKGVDDDR